MRTALKYEHHPKLFSQSTFHFWKQISVHNFMPNWQLEETEKTECLRTVVGFSESILHEWVCTSLGPKLLRGRNQVKYENKTKKNEIFNSPPQNGVRFRLPWFFLQLFFFFDKILVFLNFITYNLLDSYNIFSCEEVIKI